MKLAQFCAEAVAFEKDLTMACQRYGINTPRRIHHLLAQTAHESGGFRRLEEGLRYTTAARIRSVWPKRFATDADAAPFVNNPEKLANCVYAGRMGNGNAASGDGWRCRGRGLIQLTGRANYERASREIWHNDTLIQKPDLLLQPEGAALSACWFWATNKLNDYADRDDIVGITKRINGGTVGLEDRREWYERAMQTVTL